jgi:exopolysaccharide biosynthesis polyprenyl glycosylphosphotransferase
MQESGRIATFENENAAHRNGHELMTEITPRTIFRKECLMLCMDLAAAFGSIWLALWLRFSGDIPELHLLPYLTYLPILLMWRLAAAYVAGMYDFRQRLSPTEHIFGGFGASALGVGGGYLFLAWTQLYYTYESNLSRAVVVLDFGLLMIWFGLSRAVLLAVLRATGRKVGVLLIGPRETCDEMTAEFALHAPALLKLAGTIDPEAFSARDVSLTELIDSAAQGTNIDQAILATGNLPQEDLKRLLLHCDRKQIDLFLYPDLDLSLLASSRLVSIAGLPVVPLNRSLAQTPYVLGKRLIDFFSAAVGLLLTLIVTIPAAILIRFTSNGPIFYVQERAGKNGVPFRMVKFRTMVANAEASTGPILSNQRDPRVTAVGRILRRFRIDEIPQLWNVLRGEMSLVGPRPERVEFSQQFARDNPMYERRLLLRPGLTGLAQIHGRYDTEYTQKLRYDLIYINSVSLAMDVRILLATAHTVFTGRGAI